MSSSMKIFRFILALALLWAVIASAPPYEGYDLIWEDSFEGRAGSLPDASKWIMQDWFKDLNGDWQTYTTSPANQQLTGQGSLLIVPLRDSSATKGWTSGRLESAYTFTPAPGARTIAEASIKLGSAPASGKKGIWPAFWLLGDSHRKGTLIWPTCGEIDIMENVNGETKTQGVIHCDKNPGGICNEKTGIPGATALPDGGSGFHTYTAVIDRTPGNWMEESVTFYLDGNMYHEVTGARINNEEVWGKIAHNLIHFILNVAVGGEWPGDPNESTMDGLANAMEVEYVAHFQSSGSGGAPASQGIGSGQRQGGYGRAADSQFPQTPSPPAFPQTPRPYSDSGYPDYSQPQSPQREDLARYGSPGRPGAYETHDYGHYDSPVNYGAYEDTAPYEPSSPGFPAAESPAQGDLLPIEKYYAQRPGYKSPLPPFSQLVADNYSWLPMPAGFNEDGPIPSPWDTEPENSKPAPEGLMFDLTGTRWDPARQFSRRSAVNYHPDDDGAQPEYMPQEDSLSSEQAQSTYPRPGPGAPDYPQTQQREGSVPPGPMHNVQQHHSSSSSSMTEDEGQKANPEVRPFTPGGSGQQQNTHEPSASAKNSGQQARPAPVRTPMTDAQRENKPSPMNPTHGRYGSPDSSVPQQSHRASEQGQETSPQYPQGDSPQAVETVSQYSKDTSQKAQKPSVQYSQGDSRPAPGAVSQYPDTSESAYEPSPQYSQGYSTQAGEAISEYSQGDSQQSQGSSVAFCSAPSAGSPDHETYGVPGGWGPGTGKDCPDSATSMLKTRQISPPREGIMESESDSESSKPAMPYRFKTLSYPPPPGPDAVAPPTIAPGEFGGVQAKDKGEYLDRRRVDQGMPYRFKTPGYPPAPAPDATAPPTVSPGEYGGVQAKDKAKYLDQRGFNETAPVSSQGTPGSAKSDKVSMVAFVPVVVALLVLF